MCFSLARALHLNALQPLRSWWMLMDENKASSQGMELCRAPPQREVETKEYETSKCKAAKLRWGPTPVSPQWGPARAWHVVAVVNGVDDLSPKDMSEASTKSPSIQIPVLISPIIWTVANRFQAMFPFLDKKLERALAWARALKPSLALEWTVRLSYTRKKWYPPLM